LKVEPSPKRTREFQERLTAELPRWFGLPASNAKYAMLTEVLDGYIAECDGARRGLLLLKYPDKRGGLLDGCRPDMPSQRPG
jgi:hypothetical protein